MRTNSRKSRALLLTFLACLIIPPAAYGYIDPNAQSWLSQALTPLLVIGATVVVFLRDKATTALQRLGRYLSRFTNGAAE
jgi:hypothetical protein